MTEWKKAELELIWRSATKEDKQCHYQDSLKTTAAQFVDTLLSGFIVYWLWTYNNQTVCSVQCWKKNECDARERNQNPHNL